MRSYKSSIARCRRPEASRGMLAAATSRNARSANAVGSTQLLVRGVHPHPRSESLWAEWEADEKSLRTNRRNGELSSGRSRQSHRSPAETASVHCFSEESALQAKEVTQLPRVSSREAGQEPSRSWAASKYWRPRAITSVATRQGTSRRASSAQQ